MPDFERLARLHLERTLVVAESSGDDEWAAQLRDELKQYQTTGTRTANGEELADLRAAAETAGIKVDRRWGPDRLREEIAANAEEDED